MQAIDLKEMEGMAKRVSVLEEAVAKQAESKRDDEGTWIDLSEEKFKTKFGGRVYGDYVNFVNQDTANINAVGDQNDFFEFRRVRLFAEGEGYGIFDYKLQLDFSPEGNEIEMKDLIWGSTRFPISGTSASVISSPGQSRRADQQQIHHLHGAFAAQRIGSQPQSRCLRLQPHGERGDRVGQRRVL